MPHLAFCWLIFLTSLHLPSGFVLGGEFGLLTWLSSSLPPPSLALLVVLVLSSLSPLQFFLSPFFAEWS